MNDSEGRPPTVLVVGGGLAGLACAAALGSRGFQVTVLESRSRLGGRASSFQDAQTGQLIDTCQHVSMGCCTNFAHFCRTVGVDHLLTPQKTLYFMTRDGRISMFGADSLPAPMHLARSLLRAHYLTLAEKIRIGWGMLGLQLTDPDDDQPLLGWLRKHRQSPRMIERFWATVLVSALNESIDRLGLKYARKVFCSGFMAHRDGFQVQLPTVPLGRLYGEEMHSWFAKHGVAIETDSAAEGLAIQNDAACGLQMRRGGTRSGDFYVLALPFERLRHFLPNSLIQSTDFFAGVEHLEPSPITSVHLWYDRRVLDLPHLVLVDCLGHWIFNRGSTFLGNQYLQVVISASRMLKSLGGAEIVQRISAEIRELLPAAAMATVVRTKVITEHTATFSARPGADRWRPKQTTPVRNLYLAGDWTQTGWPATMEGAVRSGYLAAEAVLSRCGRQEQLIVPDLR